MQNQLQEEINEERKKLGKDDIDNDEPKGGGTVEKTVSTTDPESGMFVKGEHERQFAYEAHTACDDHGFVIDVEVTAGNVHDSVAWDALYDKVIAKHNVEFAVMDVGYKTPWIAKKTLDDGKIPILPYTSPKVKKEDTNNGNTPTMQQTTNIFILKGSLFVIRLQAKTVSELTAVNRRIA